MVLRGTNITQLANAFLVIMHLSLAYNSMQNKTSYWKR